MESPWNDTDKAFEPMYTEKISVNGKRDGGVERVNQSIDCVIYTDETGDPFSSESVDTTREDIVISFKERDWSYVQRVQRGDSVYRPMNNRRYAVTSVKRDIAMGWIIKARETL